MKDCLQPPEWPSYSPNNLQILSPLDTPVCLGSSFCWQCAQWIGERYPGGQHQWGNCCHNPAKRWWYNIDVITIRKEKMDLRNINEWKERGFFVLDVQNKDMTQKVVPRLQAWVTDGWRWYLLWRRESLSEKTMCQFWEGCIYKFCRIRMCPYLRLSSPKWIMSQESCASDL